MEKLMQSEKVHLTKEKETLLATLYCRALDSRSKNPLLHDEKAEEVVRRIDYDFRKLKISRDDVVSAAIRAKQLDQWTRDFLADHPDATVLHLGCGLDSRVDRIDPPKSVRWYDRDFPEVIELRRRFYPQRDGYSLIGSSVTDPSFLDKVQASGPMMMVAEGLFMYLSEHEVKELLQRLTSHFHSGQLAFDAWSRLAVRLTKFQPAVRATGAEMRWGIDDLRVLEQWVPRLQLVTEVTLTEALESARLSWVYRVMCRVINRIPPWRSLSRFLLYRF
jgi:O-methyltransferase involved in polyketide biosynthesis